MALINCTECGRQISDRANICPYCGCPQNNEPEYASFCLKRESKALFWAARYEAYLDHQRWGVLKNGDSLNVTLTCGTHHIRLVDKNSFNKVVVDNDFDISKEGLTLSFSAAVKPVLFPSSNPNQPNPQEVWSIPREQTVAVASSRLQSSTAGGRHCPRCGGLMTVQTVSEARKTGCGMILLYIILALTIFGLLIVIPLMLRRKTDTVTYAVCQNCGYKKRL